MMHESSQNTGSTGTNRVAVTGYGCVTALGANANATWQGVLQGKTARRPVSVIPVEGCRVTEGAEVDLSGLPSSSRPGRVQSRASIMVQEAAGEALNMAGLLDAEQRCVLRKIQFCVSTSACAMEMGEQFLRSIWDAKPRGRTAMVARYQAQQQVGELQRRFGFGGPVMVVANACASGANAIGHGFDLIRSGMANMVLVAGFDALCELVFAGFDGLQSLAPQACRPFDRRRNGLMLGEGAACLVLESEEHAHQRGATISGIIEGYGHSTDLGHLTQPDQEGKPLIDAMQRALAVAGLGASEIGYINAHGTATPLNDSAEARAVERIFAGTDARLSSTKAALGHTLGGAGAIEAVLCLQALKTGFLPPQINLLEPEELVANRLVHLGETRRLRHALSLNLGFGGSAAALILGAPDAGGAVS